mmetsp:Transcript_146781/g.468969  ORF Transcript_146781/g.468969 Transcript_146781/m.468969 type:complete len:902 (-) Transcript_146781:105-2810(-)
MSEKEEQLPGLGFEDFPGFSADECPAQVPDLSEHHSSLADVLKEQPGLWEALRTTRTSLHVGLARCVKVGMDNPGHRMMRTLGMVAGDEECFDSFCSLVDPVIRHHLGVEPRHLPAAAASAPACAESFAGVPRPDATGLYVVSMQACAWRSLRGFRFPPAMTLEDKHEVERLVSRACLRLQGPNQGVYLPLRGSQSYAPRPGGMTEAEEASLAKDALLFEAPDSMSRLCTGAGRHWPHGRGAFRSEAVQGLSVWVNELEHLRVAVRCLGDDLPGTLGALFGGLGALAAGLNEGSAPSPPGPFAHSERLGFLTSNLANLGTALQIIVTMQLPLLSKNPGPWQSWCAKHNVSVVCTEINGRCFELSNTDRLGASEVEVALRLSQVVSCLIQMEQRAEAGHPMDDLLAHSLEAQAEMLPPADAPPAAAQAQAMTSVLIHAAALGANAELLEANSSASGGNAEEVLSAGGSRPCSPVALSKESRPETSQSVWTLNASSVDTHHSVVQDLVGCLIDTGIERQVLESEQQGPSAAPWTELRHQIGDILINASMNGLLESALAEVMAEQSVAELNQDMEDIRGMAMNTLVASVDDGSLLRVIDNIAAARLPAETSAAAPAAAAGAPGAAVAPGAAEAREGSSLSVEQIRERVCDAFFKGLEDGQLEQALADVNFARKVPDPGPRTADVGDLRKRLATGLEAALASGALDDILADALGGEGGGGGAAVEAFKPPSRSTSTTKLGLGGGGKASKASKATASAAALIFEAVSARDRRIGELTARIRETEIRFCEQDEGYNQMIDMLTVAKQDLAHVELDIEWHRRALEGAVGRSGELQQGQRKLLSELDLQMKPIQNDPLGGLGMYSARSEISTVPGASPYGLGSTTAWMTPRPPTGRFLEPIPQRNIGAS